MKQSVFDRILVNGIRQGHMPARSEEARKWFRLKASKERNPSKDLLRESKRKRTKPQVGKMFMFQYDAKMKQTLPYWDGMPLVFVIKMYNDGFLSLNLHYAPPKVRAVIMDALYNFASDDKYNDKTKLLLSYQVLQRFARAREVQPCIKKHLFSQIDSPLIEIHPSEWDIALWLPMAKWHGASSQQVYADFRKKL